MTELRLKHIYENYTTEEQVDTILSLGIPVDTADCYIDLNGNRYVRSQNEGELDDDFFTREDIGYTPCWSAGRLIEIYCVVTHLMFPELSTPHIVKDIIVEIKKHSKYTDFSKLKSYE